MHDVCVGPGAERQRSFAKGLALVAATTGAAAVAGMPAKVVLTRVAAWTVSLSVALAVFVKR